MCSEHFDQNSADPICSYMSPAQLWKLGCVNSHTVIALLPTVTRLQLLSPDICFPFVPLAKFC